MPGSPRQADYLHLHANVSRRVRNLETGVHPVLADIDYYESAGWTTVTLNSPWTHFASGPTVFTWQFKKRFGICSMHGGVTGRSSSPTSGLVGSIPASQAPARDTELQILTPFDAPYHGRAILQTDGQIILDRGGNSTDYVCFDGITWTTD